MKPLYAPASAGKGKRIKQIIPRSHYRREAIATFDERLAKAIATTSPTDPKPVWSKSTYPTLYDAFLAFFQHEYNSMNLLLLAESLQQDRSFMMRRLKEWAVRPIEKRKHLDEYGRHVIPYLSDLMALCTSLYGFNLGLRKVKLECSTDVPPETVTVPAMEQPAVIIGYHHPLYTPGDPKEYTASFVVKFKGCTSYGEFEKQYPRHAAGILVLRELESKQHNLNDHIKEDNEFI